MVDAVLLLSGAVAVAMGGLAMAFLGGDGRAEQRRAALAKPDAKKARLATIDKSAKKKQIQESLAELEKRSKRKRVDLQTRIEQAGMSIKKQQFLLIFVAIALGLGALTYVKVRNPTISALIAVMAAAGLPNFVLARMRARRTKKFVDALPAALDIIVRGVRAGLPLGDTLRIIAQEAQEPVRSEFRKIVESRRSAFPCPRPARKWRIGCPRWNRISSRS